ncbi:MAG: Molybdenum cofactor biosynthesis protein MoaA [uncultured Aureispira sp.]|uniref:GTP 3',8-cyclase n=1 Tax=uncultured Aureispira sp. TaxID=1331704 RepID=A0A6S6SDV3_9BACT|nr:MAG: Molybdenum cofactor biosynthesis protein MoaA [uncultured Aureispira sp.]
MIKDQQNRVHDYLRISLTERCNLRCFYCMPEEGVELAPKSHLMTYEEILAIATTFVEMGVKKIRLTGGEPLVRKEAHVIIEALGKLPIELGITTNGILVDRFVDSFKKAGLKAVNISLDTLDRDKFALVTKRDDFEKVRENIDLLLAEGFLVKINVVLMRAINFDEIIDFINITEHKNLQIQFIEFMPFDGNKWDWEKGISLAEIIEKANAHYQESNVLRIEDKPNDTAVNYKIKGYKGSFAVISTITNPFCSTCNRIRLTANGRIKNCLFSTGETDLLTPFRAGEDIQPIILKSIHSKAPERGGWESLEAFSKPENHGQNRSMILIGG